LLKANVHAGQAPASQFLLASAGSKRTDWCQPARCWDIIYLLTYEKGLFLYLYLVLEQYSRKAISWLVSWNQSAEQAHRLLEGALLSENIIDLPEDQSPEIVNDRDRQMEAKPIKQMFETHQMPQFFARPRTPMTMPCGIGIFNN